MSIELIYTSAPRGLKPNTSGFCTVGMTAGMSRQATSRLEALSGYEFHFNLSDPNSRLNPIDFAHTRVALAGRTQSVLSRVAFAGADYSGRTNKIAHHFVLGDEELLPGGPAWMMGEMADGVFRSEWSEKPREFPPRRLDGLVRSRSRAPRPARRWEQVAGDAGWAGALAEAIRARRDALVFVVYKPGLDLLPLFEESLAVLPPAERWSVCFATYFTAAPADCHYHWRGVLAGSKAAATASRFPNALVIDLTGPLARPADTPFAEAARAGEVVEGPAEAAVAVSGRGMRGFALPAAAAEETLEGAGVHAVGGATVPVANGKPEACATPARPRVASRGSRTLPYLLAAAGGLLLLTNVITLKGFLDRGKHSGRAGRGSVAEDPSDGKLKELEERNYALSKELELKAEQLKRTEDRQKLWEEKSDFQEKHLAKAKGDLQDTEKRVIWYKREYELVPNHKPCPYEQASETPKVAKDLTKEVEKTAKPEGMRLVPLLPLGRADGLKRVPVDPVGNADARLACFPLKDSNGLLDLPPALKDFLIFRVEGEGVVVKHNRFVGDGKTDILRCSVDPRKGLVLEAVSGETAYAPHINCLVIETANFADGVVYQYHRQDDAARRPSEMVIRYGRNGPKDKEEKAAAYPWAKALRIRYARLNKGEPFPLFESSVLGRTKKIEFQSDDAAAGPALAQAGVVSRLLTIRRKHPADPKQDLEFVVQFDWPKETAPEQVKAAFSARSLGLYLSDLLAEGGELKKQLDSPSWQAFRKQLSRLKGEKNGLAEEKSRLDKERVDLADERQKKDKERGQAEGHHALAARTKAREHLNSLGSRQAALPKILEELPPKVKELTEKSDGLAKSLKDAGSRQKRLMVRLSELEFAKKATFDRNDKKQIDDDIKKIKDKIDEIVKTEIDPGVRAYGGVKGELKRAEEEWKEAREESKALPKRIENAKADLEAKEEAAGLAQKELDALANKVEDLKRQGKEKEGEIQKQTQKIEGKTREVNAELDRLRKVPADLYGDLGSVEILDPWGRAWWVFKLELKWDEK